MYIQKIILKNIRGFEKLEFDLTRPDGGFAGWTVFTGDNGSGKSTLIKAIAVALVGKGYANSLQPSFNGWIRANATEEESSINLRICRNEKEDLLSSGGAPPATFFTAKIGLSNGQKLTTLEDKSGSKTPERTIWSSAAGWFSCGYGPFRRVFGASSDATRQMVSPVTERFVTMFQEAASLAEVDQWMRTLKMKEMENRATEKEQLETLLELLKDDLLPNRITVDRVDSDGLWLRDRNEVQLSWGEMSDGYRAALALLADIVRHLMNTYGTSGLTARDERGKLVIQRGGVVLIDEIDAHLHPEWQQKIGFWLKAHFPNIQFLVTTHSPLICQAADPNGLFVLPEPGSGAIPRRLEDAEYQKIIVSRPDTILLSPAFGLQNTRSPVAVQSRAEFARLSSKKRAGALLSAEENQKFKQLELAIPEEEP
ncbi:MAG: AAA family ATPase [Deltaproteobacteria bacterium HGW-Deltaproteobacteria-17]|nr:MAG: AAA family ATPase [Deltaproteobacteria bacterium HGW-Deltaproteobacteria-17]